MKTTLRFVPFLLVLTAVAGCTAPRGAVLQSEILRESESEEASYALVPVTQANLAAVQSWPATGSGLALNWPEKGQSQRSRSLRPGDSVNLTIWDSQENSLLTSIEQRAVPMNGLVISPGGTIFVPYIDEVAIAGLSPEQARADIQSRLTQIAPSAQVQLAVDPGDQNMIELVSGVQRPGRYPVAARGVTILSALAEGGGIPDGLRSPVVRLQRGGQSYAALAEDLYRSPGKDVLLRGGDRVVVESDPRSFIILGATGDERTVPFEKPRHTLMEALSLGGGLLDSRADIRALLVLRTYPQKAVRIDGTGPSRTQMVFAFDLSSGDGLFAARSFAVHPDDVVLATESPLPAAGSLLGLFGSVLGIGQRL